MYCLPRLLFFVQVPTWSFDPIPYALSKDVLPSANRAYGGRSDILGQKSWFPANEGVLESPRPPALIPSSGAGSPGHLGRSKSHFRRSFNRRRRPQTCARSGSNEGILIIIRTHQREGLSLDEFARGFGPARCHCDPITMTYSDGESRFCRPFSMPWDRREHGRLVTGLL